jgi:nucleoside phosphorylase/tetratricopeptide (TPR) repeat protein
VRPVASYLSHKVGFTAEVGVRATRPYTLRLLTGFIPELSALPTPCSESGASGVTTVLDPDEFLLIVTPTTVEWDAMRSKMTRPRRVESEAPLVQGTIGGANVLCATPGKGPGLTAAVTTQLILQYRIRYVLLVGVAGGLNFAARGDLVVPTAIADLDYGKIEAGAFVRRRDYDWRPDYKLLRAAEVLGENSKGEWKSKIGEKRPDRRKPATTTARFGYIGSSSKIIDDTEYSVVCDALKTATELLAVEMEATGASAAVHVAQSHSRIGILMVRGISDLVDVSSGGSGEGTKQRGKWKPYAADVAATFTAALIKELFPRHRKSSKSGTATPKVSRSVSANDPSLVDRQEISLGTVVESAIASLGNMGALILGLEVKIDFRAPPAVAKVARRPETIDALRSQIENRTWTALSSPRGSGKTQTAILVVSERNAMRWFNADDLLDSETFKSRLRDAGDGSHDPFDGACAAVGQGGLIVLDDLLPPDGPMTESLSYLAQSASAHGVHILTLSAASLPSAIRRVLPDGEFVSQMVPDFSVAEAEDLFRLFGAPKKISAAMPLLTALARGNPTLLTAIAEYLRARQWRISVNEIEALFARAHLSEVEPEVLRRLLHDVNDAQTRELLHRLRLPRRPIPLATITELAAVEPRVDRIRERLLELEGLWVRRTAADVFEVAPLAEALPLRALDGDTERQCHVILAEEIIHRPSLGPNDVALAVTFFVGADEVNRAGALLGWALSSLVADRAWHETFVPSLWGAQQLPENMDLSLRLFVRMQHLKIARATSGDLSFLSEDIKTLIAKATEEHTTLLTLIASEAALKQEVEPLLLDVALTALERLAPVIPADGVLIAGEEFLPEHTWINAFHLAGRAIDSFADLERWTRAIESLRPALLEKLRVTPDLERKYLVDPWWLRAVEKKDDAEFYAAVERLQVLENWAASFGDDILAAYAVRAQIILTGEYLHDLESAVKAGERGLASYSSGHAQFLIREVVGTQYSVTSEWELAESWFSEALKYASAGSASERITARMRIAQVVGRRDPRLAVTHLEKALSEVRSSNSTTIDPYELPQVLGDLGTALWKAGERAEAVKVWAEAADLVLNADLTDRTMSGLFMVLHAALAYPALLARVGRPPVVPTSGKPMDEPRIGHFLREFALEADSYTSEYRTQVPMSLAYLSAAVDDRERTRTWATRAYAEAERHGDSDRLRLIALELLPLTLLDDNIGEAFRLINQRILLMPDDMVKAIPATDGDDGAVLLFLLLPFFRAARIALDNAEKARAVLGEIRTYAKEEIEGAGAKEALVTICDVSLHDEGAAVLQGIYGREDLADPVRIVARLFHSLDRGASVVDRARDHWMIAMAVHARSPAWGIGYRWIVLDFFETYWMRELLTDAFRFNRAGDVRTGISRLSHVPDAERLQSLLLGIADGLGVILPDDFRTWLRAKPLDNA